MIDVAEEKRKIYSLLFDNWKKGVTSRIARTKLRAPSGTFALWTTEPQMTKAQSGMTGEKQWEMVKPTKSQ